MASTSVAGGGSAERPAEFPRSSGATFPRPSGATFPRPSGATRIASGTVRPVSSSRLRTPTTLSISAISASEGPMWRAAKAP